MALPQTFKRLIVKTLSTDIRKAVDIINVPMLKPGPTEVLIKNKYLGINASDVNASNGKYFTNKLYPPFEIGLEGIGEIVAVGDKVTDFKVNQPVAHVGLKAYAEYVCKPATEIVSIPEINPEIIPLLVSGLSAALSLDKKGLIRPKDKVLITSAAGGTGHIAVQWAKSIGCHVIGTCSSKEKVEYLKEIGCDLAINYEKDNLSEILKSQYREGIDVIWETVGGKMFVTLLDHLAFNGRLISIGTISGYKTNATIPLINIDSFPRRLLLNSLSLNGFMLFHHMEYIPAYFAILSTMQKEGKIKVKIDNGSRSKDGEFVGLESIVRAVEFMYDGKNIGKVIVAL